MSETGMIFIVGNSRSGTTMLGRMLGKNSSVYSFPELHLFGPCIPHGKELEAIDKATAIKIFCWLLDVSTKGFHHKRNPELFLASATLLADEFFKEGVDAWDAYRYFVMHVTRENGKTLPSEDLPGNIFKLNQIFQKFKDVKVVHIVRDPRDVVLSQKNRHLRRKMGGHYVSKKEALRVWSNYHPFVIARLWRNAVTSALNIKNEDIITVHFEDLLAQPEEVLNRICLHTGIQFEPIMLKVPQVGSSTQKDDPSKMGVDAGRSGAWQRGGLSDAEIAICEEVNGDIMQRLNYPLSGKKLSLASKIGYALLLPFKGALALALNWNRTKGLLNFLIHRIFK